MPRIFHSSCYQWIIYALILSLGRIALLCSLYFMNTPLGGPIVENVNKFIWHTIYVEAGNSMAIACCFFIISKFVQGSGIKVLKVAAIVTATLYLTLAGTDDEIMRWMGQKLSFSFIRTYILAFTDVELASNIFKGDAFHFLLTVFIVVFFSILAAFYTIKSDFTKTWKQCTRRNYVTLCVMLVLAVIGSTSFWWYNPVERRQVRIKPVVYNFIGNFLEFFETSDPPQNYREGIIALGGNPDAKYPFWKKAKNETEAFETFKQKPFDEKPDIILLTIESLRGWTADMRVEKNCNRAPNLCKLAQNSLYYPYAYSVGFPSIEGLLGIMEGVWSLPHHVLLNSYPNTQMRSISEILRDAGYHTEVLIGSDPYFDNGMVWFQKWFDYVEYKPENHNDIAMANRFIEHYKTRPDGKPLFYHWMSASMHIPFDLPKDMGEKPDDINEAYLRALAYTDSALGVLMKTIENGPRAENTLIILTGDHSLGNSKQMAAAEKFGQASDGFTWISLLFSGPGITPKMETHPVSQADIAPSILGYLKLDASNHFMGTNLLDCMDTSCTQHYNPVYSFREGDMGLRTDSITYLLTQVDGKSPAIALKKDSIPSWDTQESVEGYVNGEPADIPHEELIKATETMRAASNAWKYVIYKNRLMPTKE